MSSKWQKLADFLVNYSTRIQSGEIAMIHCIDGVNEEFVNELIESIFKAGGEPIIWQDTSVYWERIIRGPSNRALEIMLSDRLEQIKKAQVVFHLYCEHNVCEFADLPAERHDFYLKLEQPICDWRCNKTKRVLTCLPGKAGAQLAGMSFARFEKFYFDTCLGVDYPKMARAMDILISRMEIADQVRIFGPGTDFAFSIKGIPAIKCAGTENLPDGEVFTAPIRDSANGEISFNTPTNYNGRLFGPISLSYERGRLIDVNCADPQQSDKAREILHTDEGAQYIGEFAFGLNPYIIDPVQEILFDEKIAGSVHVTPGSCYEEASNGNQSAIHWDMILRQTAKCGGGEVYFDGELIRQDGLFLGELAALNPENLEV